MENKLKQGLTTKLHFGMNTIKNNLSLCSNFKRNILNKMFFHFHITFIRSSNKKREKFHIKTLSCIRVKASFVVEAALVLPVFILTVTLFLGFFQVLAVEIQMNQALSYTVSEIAEENPIFEEMRAKALLQAQLQEQEFEESRIYNGWSGIELKNDNSDDEYVRLWVEYKITLPANLFGKDYVEVTQSAISRRWTGKSLMEEDSEGWVYITPYGVAYHKTTGCNYLDLSVWAVSVEQVSAQRNADGGKYKRCAVCRKKFAAADSVYVTNYGDYYHYSLTCRRLKRTVYRVSLDNLENRTPCKKCYGDSVSQ